MNVIGGKKRAPKPVGFGSPEDCVVEVEHGTVGIQKLPESINVDKVVNIDDIPALSRTLERMMRGLKTLDAEFCIKSDTIGEVWLVPAYTDTGRNEMSFEDATKIVVLCAAFGGKVESINFFQKKNVVIPEE